MRIAMVTSGFLPLPAVRGGAVESLIMNLLNENENMNNNVEFYIFSIYDQEAIDESKRYKKTHFCYIEPPKFIKIFDKLIYYIVDRILKKEQSSKYRYITQRYYYLRAASKKISKQQFDRLVLENHPTQFKVLKWHNNSKKYKGKYFYHCHNEIKKLYGCKRIAQNCSKYICVSKYIADQVKEVVGVDNSRTTVARNCVNNKLFDRDVSPSEKRNIKKKYNIGDNDKIVLFTGRLVEEKGIEQLIRSFDYIDDEMIKLLIVGASISSENGVSGYEKKLLELVKKNRNRIIFTGFVDYSEIYKYYKMADIVVLPSICEDAAPLAVIESLYCAKPLITTISGGIPEYASSQAAVLLERNKNLAKNIAVFINAVIRDQKIMRRMSKKAKECSSDMTTEKYYEIFMEALNEKN